MLDKLLAKVDTRTLLAYMAMLNLILVIFLLSRFSIPAENRDIFNMLCGALIVLVKDAYAYYYNTTDNGTKKDDTIKAVALSTLPPQDGKV